MMKHTDMCLTESDNSRKNHYHRLGILSIISFSIPLFMRWVPGTLSIDEQRLYGIIQYGDIFQHGKAYLFLFFCLVALFLLIPCIRRKEFPTTAYVWPFLAMVLLSTVSSLMSVHGTIPFNGVVERYESQWVFIGYFVLMLLSITLSEERNISGVLYRLLLIQTSLLSVISIGQYYGFDFLNWYPIRVLITGQVLAEQFPVIASASSKVYATLGNPGILAQYMSAVLPFLAGCVMIDAIQKPIKAMFITGLALFVGLSTGAGSFLIGAGVGLTVLNLCMDPKLFIKNRNTLLSILIVGVLLGAPHISAIHNAESAIIAVFFILINGAISLSRKMQSVNGKRYLFLLSIIVGVVICIMGVKFMEKPPYFNRLEVINNRLIVDTREGVHFIESYDSMPVFSDAFGQKIPVQLDRGEIKSKNLDLNKMIYGLTVSQQGRILTMGLTEMGFYLNGSTLVALDRNGNPVDLRTPQRMGFKDLGHLFSCRGYIWSTSASLIRNHILFGSGADTFVFEFPQNDYGGKYSQFGTPYVIVDKPHSMYLQFAIQFGLLALGLFLTGIFRVIVDAIKITKGGSGQGSELLPMIAGLLGFFSASVFNDSSVSSSPIMWIFIGCLIGRIAVLKRTLIYRR